MPYPLGQLLELRQREVDDQADAVRQAETALEACQRTYEGLVAATDAARSAFRSHLQKSLATSPTTDAPPVHHAALTARAGASHQAYLDRLRRQVEAAQAAATTYQKDTLAPAQAAVTQARAHLLEKRADLKVMEKHREKFQKTEKLTAERKAAAEADDQALATRRWTTSPANGR